MSLLRRRTFKPGTQAAIALLLSAARRRCWGPRRATPPPPSAPQCQAAPRPLPNRRLAPLKAHPPCLPSSSA
uniref:Uncharacterized protein n=1 Tax=Oryza glumipatula TaxID=40148 RepID=A0A0E0A9S1_9ORYZ